MTTGKKIKIILVDDHDILMDGIASILNEAPGMQVVGKASSVAVALDRIRQAEPELVMTDISMGAVSGIELTKQVVQEFPLVKVMVLSMHDHIQYISAALEAGALGYLLKNVKQEELVVAIRTVLEGRRYIQQSLAGAYVRGLQQQKAMEKQSVLSSREIEIVRLIAQELTSTEISRKLFISEHTVETHRKNIARKTGVKTVVGLLNYAREHGLI